MSPAALLIGGDARHLPIRDESIQCVVTSPPYWGLRSYGTDPRVWGGDEGHAHEWGEWREVHDERESAIAGKSRTTDRAYGGDASRRFDGNHQKHTAGAFCPCGAWRGELGLEPTPELYVAHLVAVFREVRRVLRDDGTCWVNLGDSYAAAAVGSFNGGGFKDKSARTGGRDLSGVEQSGAMSKIAPGLKPKDLVGIPWRVAFALQADGWWLRSDIVWAKPNPMPESIIDRPTKAHEYIFLLSKSARYYYDAEAVKEPIESGPSDVRKMLESLDRLGGKHKALVDPLAAASSTTRVGTKRAVGDPSGRNRRTVWTIATEPYPEAHFACVDAETECLTVDGWKRYDQVMPGDLAAQYDLDADLLSWAPVEAVAHYPVVDEPMVAARSRDLTLLLTRNHRTVIRRRHPRSRLWGRATFVEADGLRTSHGIPVAGIWRGGPWSVPPGLDAAWAEILGWYIAEGHEPRSSWTVDLYQSPTANPDKTARITKLLDTVGAEYQTTTASRRWANREATLTCFRVGGFAAIRLREWAPGKRLALDVLRWPELELGALLAGLIGGDGHVRPDDGRASFIQRDRQTVDLVQAVAVRLGYATKATRRSGGTWTVYLTRKRVISLRGTSGEGARIETERYTGIVWCPKLPAGTWVARKNGRAFITGNTFPEKLVEPCILAGTSERGACPACGAPWGREVARTGLREIARGMDGERPKLRARQEMGLASNTTALSASNSHNASTPQAPIVTTLGWSPSCDCPPADPVPCRVLDPFSGSGTTVAVAERLGRVGVGVELKPEYRQLARRRTAQAGLL